MWFLWPPDKTSAYKSVSECVCVCVCVDVKSQGLFPVSLPCLINFTTQFVTDTDHQSHTCMRIHIHVHPRTHFFIPLSNFWFFWGFFSLSLTALILSSLVFTHFLVIWLTSSSSYVTFSLLSLVLLKETLALALLEVLFASLLYSASSFLFSSP